MRIENCSHTSDVSRYFLENALQLLNPTKAEAVLFGTRQRLCRTDYSETKIITFARF